tara:strand:+ start:43 stop:1365 length:1323 start_codon:yes stop_codon:yes gene_type:complete
MEGVIQEMNKGALNMFGYSKDELVGIKRVSIFSEADIVIQNVLGWLDEANKKGKSIVKTRFKRKDGSLFNAEILITPNYANGKDKAQTGYCGITKEINEKVDIPIKFSTKLIRGIAITRGGFTLASILPMVVVSYFLSSIGNLSFLNSILAIGGVFFLHLFSNLYNDYFDVKHGTDEANTEYFNVGDKSTVLRGAQISGGSRAIELGLITLENTKKLANIMLFISMIFLVMVCCNSYLITNSFSNIKSMGLIALIGSLLGYFYTAKPIRLSGRKGLGELTIFLSFGPLLTVGSAIAMSTNTIVLDYQNLRDFILIGIPLGLLTTNILFINQFPDYNSDKISGKINLVVLFGKKLSRWIFLLNVTLTIFFSYFLKNVISSKVLNFNETAYSVIISILALYGIIISLGLFKNYNKRSLVYFNIQTIYYQIFFCFGIIISFYF